MACVVPCKVVSQIAHLNDTPLEPQWPMQPEFLRYNPIVETQFPGD